MKFNIKVVVFALLTWVSITSSLIFLAYAAYGNFLFSILFLLSVSGSIVFISVLHKIEKERVKNKRDFDIIAIILALLIGFFITLSLISLIHLIIYGDTLNLISFLIYAVLFGIFLYPLYAFFENQSLN